METQRKSMSKLIKILASCLLAVSPAITSGCTELKPTPREAYIEYAEKDNTFIERKQEGVDIHILEYDGISRLEFYKNNELLFSSTSLRELIQTGVWGGEGVVDGKVVWQSPRLPLERGFDNYHLTLLYGYNIFKGLINKNDSLTLRVYDRRGKVRNLTLEKGIESAEGIR